MTLHIPDVLMLGLIGLLGFCCQWLAWRIKLPAILFLLICGILLGPTFSILNTDAIFGDLLIPFVSLSVAVILFEGSLTLKRSELDDIGTTVRRMVSTGLVINAIIVTLAVRTFTDLNWSLSALFGCIMVVTGPTVIVPMLRAARLNTRIAKVLRWEGIVIDPIGALLAVLVFEFIVTQHSNKEIIDVIRIFSTTIFIGFIVGGIAGWLLGQLLRNHWIPDYLENFASLTFVCGAFALSETIEHESGLLAVTVMGIWLANMRGVHIRSILHFKENLTVVFVSILFIILAARLNFEQLQQLGFGAIAVFLVMQFIARPAKVFFSTRSSSFNFRERLILSWIGPRGIVAAAVSAVFALRLEELGVENAELLVPLAFSIIIGTVLLQGTTARWIATLLKVTEPNTKGFVIIGGNPVALQFAKVLKEAGIDSVICDNYWDNISEARMEGLNTYYGNPISNHADMYLDISKYSGLLGLSYSAELNMAAALRYREEFGVTNLYCLPSPTHKEKEQRDVDRKYSGHTLFDQNITYGKLIQYLNQGAKLKKTQLSEEYDYDAWLEDRESSPAILVFTLDLKDKLYWNISGHDLSPKTGWTIVYLSLKGNNEIS